MKVIIDIAPLKSKHKTRGIGTYTRKLVESICQIDKNNQYILTTKTEQIEAADIIHYPYFDLFFRTLPLKKKTKTVVTVHDVVPLIFPKQFPAGIKGTFNFFLQKRAVKNVDAVITDSCNSKDDLIKLLDIEAEKISVIYLAAAGDFNKKNQNAVNKISAKYHLPDKYILYVGDVNYNKNLNNLISAYALMQKKYNWLHLVLVGKAFADRKLHEVNQIKKLIKKLNIEEKVHLKSNVPLEPDDDLAALYSGCNLYLQPSLYEGFGLPILEAMACEAPVVTSNISSIPEVTGKNAVFVDPKSPDSIAWGVDKILNMHSSAKQKLLSAAKEHAASFTWEKTARATIQVYKEVLGA